MPTIAVNGTRLYYEDVGTGPETILFSHGLLWDRRLFEPQVAALRADYRCIAYDHRGQGRSAVPSEATIPTDLLAADAIALVEALGVGPVHVVGLSMGGFVGMRLAVWRPDLVRSLCLIETSADPEPRPNVPRYKALNLVVRLAGARAVSSRVLPIMFGRTFLDDPDRAAERDRWRGILESNAKSVTKSVNGVLQRPSFADQLAHIEAPTVVVVGDEDVATTPAKAQRMVDRIPGARLVRIPAAGHSSTIEQPEAVTAAIRSLLTEASDGAPSPEAAP
ncbi:alpha/beta fold hydrolase [Egicoccus halophilus]|uniref:2-succinyl-6-hydroxy-2,4-cyclohexadiene-1-carboxylate synthase n=1 Tax=Egicoccus halophilus TaxID=1670830 RepID=A0A8J3EVH8_9ACTN|nr:alpha/beta fold hydrolase [Egicoccus halophilus]GGI08164.1 2-succinyl-6-hydroxy-2,4-cyclohexadiene-1-carboxylate synthase [Egicoccus halophilus]